ncbi:protein of unknown function DUF4005 [Dillenia turbinata]|uniref:DUF4005 domain-containing protein n=1 Tax=Dillenia turbinata TaxID=194707 RepID=A0AAN8WFC0_9MAGN
MGKAARWFRNLLTGRKPNPIDPNKPPKVKKRWSFVKSYREKSQSQTIQPQAQAHVERVVGYDGADSVDPNKHAIAVAAATATVAEAAVAAAQAAAAVVRLTSNGRCGSNTSAYVSGNYLIREGWAAVKIQSLFRGYLARRALRALKALVKLQALVRGHIVRKQTVNILQRMQALLRAQARARAGRVQVLESPHPNGKSSQVQNPGPPTPEKFEHNIRAKSGKRDPSPGLKRNSSRSTSRVNNVERAELGRSWVDPQSDEGSGNQQGPPVRIGMVDDEKSAKILEVDTGKPQVSSKRRNLFQSSNNTVSSDQISHCFTTSKDSTSHQTVPSPLSCEVQSLSPLKFSHEVEDCFCTADNSPQYYSASSRAASSKGGPFTPAKSDGTRSILSSYSDYPNYMANTESSRAKVRSLSAPKQRPQFEKSGSTKRYSLYGYGDSRSRSQKVSSLHTNFTNKAYPGSGHLDRLGMPVTAEVSGFSGVLRYRD